MVCSRDSSWPADPLVKSVAFVAAIEEVGTRLVVAAVVVAAAVVAAAWDSPTACGMGA